MNRSFFVFFLAAAGLVRAQGPAPSPFPFPVASPSPSKLIETPRSQPHDLTRADLEAFLDALIPSQLENRNIAGAVIGAVKEGQVLLAKGYGYADYKEKKPVSASETLFRPGSIAKLFTATAVMQLVEQGRLDLDHDVAGYIDFPIPKTYAEPITLRRLLTHTAGFEETLKNLFVPNEKSMRPLRDYLVAAMPARIFAPGKVPSYSNYGLSLAGYIVQRTSGEKFEDYVTNHILRPLQMAHSTFDQPLPASIAAGMSNGYIEATKPPQHFEFVQAAPAGSLSATASDMCRFMLAILGGGTLEGATILQQGTVDQMQSRQFEVHPALNAIGLVFMEYTMNGMKAWGHGGDSIYFHSDLWLVPDAKFGFFISYNSAAPRPGGGRGEILRALFDRYFPNTETAPEPVDKAREDARDVSGVYMNSRRAESTLLKLPALLGQTTVSAVADGTITLDDSKNLRGQLKRWREVAPLVYGEVDGHDKMAFRRGASGRVTELLPQPPIFESQRPVWYENKRLVLPLVGGSIAVLSLTVLLWPVAAIMRKRYDRPLQLGDGQRALFWSLRIVCLLEIIWLLLLAILASRAGTDISLLGEGLNPWLHFLHIFGWLLVAGTISLIVSTVLVWKEYTPGLWLKVQAILVTLASIGFLSFIWHCHLLDASLKF